MAIMYDEPVQHIIGVPAGTLLVFHPSSDWNERKNGCILIWDNDIGINLSPGNRQFGCPLPGMNLLFMNLLLVIRIDASDYFSIDIKWALGNNPALFLW